MRLDVPYRSLIWCPYVYLDLGSFGQRGYWRTDLTCWFAWYNQFGRSLWKPES